MWAKVTIERTAFLINNNTLTCVKVYISVKLAQSTIYSVQYNNSIMEYSKEQY